MLQTIITFGLKLYILKEQLDTISALCVMNVTNLFCDMT